MRATTLFAMLIMGIAALIIAPAITTGQPGGGFGGRKGGFGGGGFGGGGMMMSQDPGALFDNYLSKGRGFFLINETRTLREPLTQYAQEKGITNGQITRQQFLDFQEQMKAKVGGGGGAPPGGPGGFGGGFGKKGGFDGGGPGGFGGGFGKKGGFDGSSRGGADMSAAPPNPDLVNQWAEADFKKRDRNEDGKLNIDEMPDSLRRSLTRWDKNNDGLIDLTEYKEYFATRLQGNDDQGPKGIAAIIIDDDELDRKPVVFRAGGKMPANLPPWFKQLDTDGDGQVAQYEWRRAGKPMDEFRNWDLNDDGFITPEEAMKTQMVLTKDAKDTKNSLADSSTASGGSERPKMNGGGDRPQFFGKGNRPFGGGGDPSASSDGGGGFGGFGKGNKNGFGKGNKKGNRPSADQP